MGVLKGVQRLLRAHEYEPILFSSAEAFKNHTDFETAACVILDINLNDGSGIELRQGLKAAGVSVPVIYMTGNEDPAVRKAALDSGCIAFLTKPFAPLYWTPVVSLRVVGPRQFPKTQCETDTVARVAVVRSGARRIPGSHRSNRPLQRGAVLRSLRLRLCFASAARVDVALVCGAQNQIIGAQSRDWAPLLR